MVPKVANQLITNVQHKVQNWIKAGVTVMLLQQSLASALAGYIWPGLPNDLL